MDLNISWYKEPVVFGLLGVPLTHSWPLKVVCVSPDVTALPSEIFVMHYRPENPTGDIFECVASSPQMEEIGTTPDLNPETYTPYYRVDNISLLFRSEQERELKQEQIKHHINLLITNATYDANLVEVETETLSGY
jgi:hypothetical protein